MDIVHKTVSSHVTQEKTHLTKTIKHTASCLIYLKRKKSPTQDTSGSHGAFIGSMLDKLIYVYMFFLSLNSMELNCR